MTISGRWAARWAGLRRACGFGVVGLLALATPGVAAEPSWGGRPEPARGCGAYGSYPCQFVPRIGSDGRPGPVYEGGPRCVRRWTPDGVRRLCRAF